MRWRGATILVSALLLPAPLLAAVFQLAPYKDKLFANPPPVQKLYGGSFEIVEYSVQRDLRERDEIPETKAKAEYVSLDTKAMEQTLLMTDGAYKTSLALVGDLKKPATSIVMFLHGRGAGLEAGFDDWNFGGNFNRIKNLMMRNGGLYVSPSFSDFGETGRGQIKGIMLALAKTSPSAPVFLACASAAGELCVSLAADKEASARLGGILFLGAGLRDFESGAAVFAGTRPRVPLFIGHDSEDTVVNWVRLELFFKTLKAAVPSYPARFTLYAPGQHGTPMRMVDWREVINWMLRARA